MCPTGGRLPMTRPTMSISGAEADAEIAADWSLRVWMAVLAFTAWTGTPLWVDIIVLGLAVASHWQVRSFINIRRATPVYLWSWATVVAAGFAATNLLYPGDTYVLVTLLIFPYFLFILAFLWRRLPRQLVAAQFAAEQGASSTDAPAQGDPNRDDLANAPARDRE